MLNALHFPWWLIVLLGVTAVLCLYNADLRTNLRVKQSAIGVLVLVAALVAIRLLFPTDIERVEQSTRDLCQSAVDQNWPRFTSFLAPDITVSLTPSAPALTKPDQVTFAATYACNDVHLSALKVTSLQSTQTGDSISTICRITTVQDIKEYGGDNTPLPSTWTLEWRRAGAVWLLDHVTLTDIAGQKPSDVPELEHLRTH